MTKTIDAAHLAIWESSNANWLAFVEMDFASGFVRLHSGLGDLTVEGNIYNGIGDLGKISPITESIDNTPHAMQFSLSGLDAGLVTTALTEDYFGRSVRVFFGTLDANGALSVQPNLFWGGRMEKMEAQIGEENAILVTAESYNSIGQRASNIRYTDEDQQRAHAGDVFFEFLDQVQDVNFRWGGQRVQGGRGSFSDLDIGPRENIRLFNIPR